MATAYVANIVVQYQDGAMENIPVTGDDVTTNNWLGNDGLAPIRLNGSHGNAIIRDVQISPAPTSTRTALIRVNGKLISDVVLLGANLWNAASGRQFQLVPLKLPSAASLTFAQLT